MTFQLCEMERIDCNDPWVLSFVQWKECNAWSVDLRRLQWCIFGCQLTPEPCCHPLLWRPFLESTSSRHNRSSSGVKKLGNRSQKIRPHFLRRNRPGGIVCQVQTPSPPKKMICGSEKVSTKMAIPKIWFLWGFALVLNKGERCSFDSGNWTKFKFSF